MRFNGVDIPQGAMIVNAYLQFQVDETSSVATLLTIEGEDIDNAATFISSTGNISSRTRTAAAVPWSPVPWTTVGEAGPDQRTPNMASVIQEIVNRPGWSDGNSLVVIITGTGTRWAESYDGDPDGAPSLCWGFCNRSRGGLPANFKRNSSFSLTPLSQQCARIFKTRPSWATDHLRAFSQLLFIS
jgi:hypothetical protein